MKKITILFAALLLTVGVSFAQHGGHGGGGFSRGGGGGSFRSSGTSSFRSSGTSSFRSSGASFRRISSPRSTAGIHGVYRGGYVGSPRANYGAGSYRGNYGYRGSYGYYGGHYGGYYGGRGYYGGGYWGWPYYGFGLGFGLGFGWPYYGYGYPYYSSPYYYGNGGYYDNGYYDDAPAQSQNNQNNAAPQNGNPLPPENSYNEKGEGSYYNNDTIYTQKPEPGSTRTDSQGRKWIEAHWKHTDEGWVWIEGYWKKQQQ